jgi:hypothetical protein
VSCTGKARLTARNELWEHDADEQSLNSFGHPDQSKFAFDSRPPSSYGGNPIDSPRFRALSPAVPYPELRHSAYDIPQLGYGSPTGFAPSHVPSASVGERRIERGVYGRAGAPSGGLEYQSIYSVDPHASAPHPSYAPATTWTASGTPQSRPLSAHLLERRDSFEALPHAQPPLRRESFESDREERDIPKADPSSISSAALHASIVRICAEADLESLTKRSVRRQLEQEYGIDLGGRKDEVGRIVEAVIEQDVRAIRACDRFSKLTR